MTTYNGWTNYATWNHNLTCVDGNQEYWEEMIPTLEGLDPEEYTINWDTVIEKIAMGLEDEFDCMVDEVDNHYFRSVLHNTGSEINWFEIAEHIVEDYKANNNIK